MIRYIIQTLDTIGAPGYHQDDIKMLKICTISICNSAIPQFFTENDLTLSNQFKLKPVNAYINQLLLITQKF